MWCRTGANNIRRDWVLYPVAVLLLRRRSCPQPRHEAHASGQVSFSLSQARVSRGTLFCLNFNQGCKVPRKGERHTRRGIELATDRLHRRARLLLIHLSICNVIPFCTTDILLSLPFFHYWTLLHPSTFLASLIIGIEFNLPFCWTLRKVNRTTPPATPPV